MTTEQHHPETVRIVCTDCDFAKQVSKADQRAADVIIEHGRKTGHKLTSEPGE